MSIEITVRRMDADEEVKELAQKKAEALMLEYPRIEFVRVIMKRDKHRFGTEVFVQGKARVRVGAAEEKSDIVVALDAAFDKIHKQMRRLRKKDQSRRRTAIQGKQKSQAI